MSILSTRAFNRGSREERVCGDEGSRCSIPIAEFHLGLSVAWSVSGRQPTGSRGVDLRIASAEKAPMSRRRWRPMTDLESDEASSKQ